MRYYKIYHKNCRVTKAYIELSESEFDSEIAGVIDDRLSIFEDLSDEEIEIESDRIYEEVEAEAKDSGCNAGDYNLYIRDDESDMYDIGRENR